MSVGVATAIDLAIELLTQASKISTLVAAAQQRGDTKLSKEEWDVIIADRDAAFARLESVLDPDDGGPV